MAERCVKGDYIGFTFGGVHSSELGLMRVSDGSRYDTDLLPPLQDKTAQVNGRDGAVYFGSQYNTKPIKVPVAFDNMTEDGFNRLKRLLQDKKPKYLWFDETPYKQWLVKSANVQNFKWVCFDESHNGKEKRIYKGEGTLEFSCFSPYAESRIKFIDETVEQIQVWNDFTSPRRLSFLKRDEEWLGHPYYYQTTSNNDIRNTIKKGFSGDGFIRVSDVSSRIFCSTGRYLNQESGAYSVFIDQKPQSKLVPVCFYFNGGFFSNYDDYYKGAMTTWYDFTTGKPITRTVSIPDSIQDLLYTIEHSDSYTKIDFPLIMTSKGNIYPMINNRSKGEYVGEILINGITYLFDKNYPVALQFRKDITIDYNYNFQEWNNTHFKSNFNEHYEKYNTYIPDYGIYLYNSGDIEVPINIYYIDKETKKFPGQELFLCRESVTGDIQYFNEGSLKIKSFDFIGDDVGFIIDSKIKMIKGIDKKGNITGNVYNKFIEKGDFFKLPPSPEFNIETYYYDGYFDYCIMTQKSEGVYTIILPGFQKVEYKYQYI